MAFEVPPELRGRADRAALLAVERWGEPPRFALCCGGDDPLAVVAHPRQSSSLAQRREARECNIVTLGLDPPLEELAHRLSLRLHDRVVLALERLAPAVTALSDSKLPAPAGSIGELFRGVARALMETVSGTMSSITTADDVGPVADALRVIEAIEQACALAEMFASCASPASGGATPVESSRGDFLLREGHPGYRAGAIDVSLALLQCSLILSDPRLTARRLLRDQACPIAMEEFAAVLASRSWEDARCDLARNPRAASKLALRVAAESARLDLRWESGRAVVSLHLIRDVCAEGGRIRPQPRSGIRGAPTRTAGTQGGARTKFTTGLKWVYRMAIRR
jgi:hypothetical protein